MAYVMIVAALPYKIWVIPR